MPSGGLPPGEGLPWQLLSEKWHSGMEKILVPGGQDAHVPLLALPSAPV